MTKTSNEIADALLRQCFGKRETAAQIAEPRSRETFAMQPEASRIWRGVHKALTEGQS